MMKRIGLALALVVGMAGSANAQVSTTASVTAEVLAALQWTTVDGIVDFGIVSPGDGSVTVAATNGAGAGFELVGEPGRSVTLTFNVTGSGGTAGALDSGANSMALALDVAQGADQTDASLASAITTGSTMTLDADGVQGVWVGGDLTVGGTQASGTYTGTVTLSVAY